MFVLLKKDRIISFAFTVCVIIGMLAFANINNKEEVVETSGNIIENRVENNELGNSLNDNNTQNNLEKTV